MKKPPGGHMQRVRQIAMRLALIGELTRSRLQEETRLSQRTAFRWIRTLLDEGTIVQVGQKKVRDRGPARKVYGLAEGVSMIVTDLWITPSTNELKEREDAMGNRWYWGYCLDTEDEDWHGPFQTQAEALADARRTMPGEEDGSFIFWMRD